MASAAISTPLSTVMRALDAQYRLASSSTRPRTVPQREQPQGDSNSAPPGSKRKSPHGKAPHGRDSRRKRPKKKEKRRKPQQADCEIELETPTAADFTRAIGGLKKHQYKKTETKTEMSPPEEDENSPECYADSPAVPDPEDDSREPRVVVDVSEEPSEQTTPRPRRVQVPLHTRTMARSRAATKRPTARTKTLEPNWWHERPVRKIKPRLDCLPPEVRQGIYRALLVADRPILVYGKWSKIFTRHRPALHTSILRVRRLFFEEALPILYGENMFLYRLRDPPALFAELYNVDQLPHEAEDGGVTAGEDEMEFGEDDDWDMQDEALEGNGPGGAPANQNGGDDQDDESSDGYNSHDDFFDEEGEEAEDGEYEDEDDDDDDHSEYEEQPRRAKTQRSRKQSKPDIDVNKFKFLIRHITVEAESNRCSPKFKSIMAQALDVFAYRHVSAPDPAAQRNPRGRPSKKALERPSNIHTLTIRVAPTHAAARWTFLDFFDAGSPVLQAALSAQPHFLRVELARRRSAASLFKDGDLYGTRLVGDMRPYRATRRAQACAEDDGWRHDRAMLMERRRQTRRCELAVAELRETVHACCTRRWLAADDGPAGDGVVDYHRGFWAGVEWDESNGLDGLSS